ncbi:MAG: hypothetical protein DRJ37_02815 [Thermoprotei archaeon]|nr:MAG: hypothetical protein DRJ37_02815 [Thermoprotei archaeon]
MKRLLYAILSFLVVVVVLSLILVIFYPFKLKGVKKEESEKIIKSGIRVSVDLPSKAKTGEVVDYRIIVENTGVFDLNVTVRDSLGFEWTGFLAAGKFKEFYNSFEARIAGVLKNEVEAVGRYNDRIVKSSVFDEILVEATRYSLIDAGDQGLITFEPRGTGMFMGKSIELKIESEINFEIEVEVEPGWILLSSGPGQNMIVAETSIIRLKPQVEVEVKIVAYCLDMYKDAPSADETFAIQQFPEPYSSDVQKLMKCVDKAPKGRKTLKAVQIALWVVLENVSKRDIRIFPPPSDSDICNAIWLLKNSGLKVEDYELYREMIKEVKERPDLPVEIYYNIVFKDGKAFVYGEVENLGDLAIEGIRIKIVLFDKNGSVTWLSTIHPFGYVLYPGEKTSFEYLIQIDLLGIDPSDVYCDAWVFSISKALLENYYREFQLSNITVLTEDDSMTVEGIVENAGLFEAKYVVIVISVYDSAENLVGCGFYYISHMDVDQDKRFKIFVRLWGVADHWDIRVESRKAS